MENKVDTVICLWMEKTFRAKPHWVNLWSPLPIIHYYHNKQLQVKKSQYLIPTYSWTLTPIHNWTCSVVTISHFQCTAPSTWLTNRYVDPSSGLLLCTNPSTWLTHQLKKDVGVGKIHVCIAYKTYVTEN